MKQPVDGVSFSVVPTRIKGATLQLVPVSHFFLSLFLELVVVATVCRESSIALFCDKNLGNYAGLVSTDK